MMSYCCPLCSTTLRNCSKKWLCKEQCLLNVQFSGVPYSFPKPHPSYHSINVRQSLVCLLSQSSECCCYTSGKLGTQISGPIRVGATSKNSSFFFLRLKVNLFFLNWSLPSISPAVCSSVVPLLHTKPTALFPYRCTGCNFQSCRQCE